MTDNAIAEDKPFTAEALPSATIQRVYCGVDIGKRHHVAAVIDAAGDVLCKPFSFANDAKGFGTFFERLEKLGGPSRLSLGMEATGHYWYALHDAVRQHGYNIAVLNPIQTAQQAKQSIRKQRNDRIDAGHIATVIKNGQARTALVPGEMAMNCRQLTRLWESLRLQRARIKQLIRSRLEAAWPEYEDCFTDIFGATSLRVLRSAQTPQDLLLLEKDALVREVRAASFGRLGSAAVERIWQSAAQSVGMRRGLHGVRIAVTSLLDQLEAFKPVRLQLEVQIKTLAEQLPSYLLTLPGANPLRIAGLYGETDPISAFTSADQLVAFAGLDPTVSQSGEYEAPRRHISKRGSPYLRRTLWAMASVEVRREGPWRDYYQRRRAQGMHHLATITAAAIKLTRAAWRIMTEQRDYLPEPPKPKP